MAREIAARRLAAAHMIDSFSSDEIAIATLERFVERISEASRRLDANLKLLRHDYDSADLAILWNLATRDLPLLDVAIQRLLASPEQPEHRGSG